MKTFAPLLVLIATALPVALPAAPTNLIALLQARYESDMKTESGRRWWHGAVISRVADPSNGVTITTFKSGEVFRDPAKITTNADRVRAANKRMTRQVVTNGVPARLAAARIRRAREYAPTNVTLTVTAGENQKQNEL